MTGKDQIEHASLTDVGLRRAQNQDAHAVTLANNAEQWLKHGHIFLVADGMGAHAVGELASELATSIIPLTYCKYAAEGPVEALEKAFVEANTSIHNKGQQNRDFQGMGTTSSALVLRQEGAWVGHVGDSRVYRIRDHQLEQLSFDHSLLWELARRQKVRPDQIQGVPSNVIVRSLGPEDHVEVDVEGPHPVRKGDLFLLCSDGLSGQVTPKEIGAVTAHLPLNEACQLLIDLANLNGGPDNITVIIVRAEQDLGKEGAGSADKDAARLNWLKSIPWPFPVLALGVLLALGAVWMSIEDMTGGRLVFMLAATSILGGIVGLLRNFLQERGGKPRPTRRKPRTHVFSHSSCVVEPPLLEKFVHAETVLQQRFRDKKWETDWESFNRHVKDAETHTKSSDLSAAFQAHCRALAVLTTVLRGKRKKDEGFEPVWEKVGEAEQGREPA